MNKHHDELKTQFQLLTNVQKDLKQSFDHVESDWQTSGQLPCFSEINRWEEDFIERVRQVAHHARNTANEMMVTNMVHLRHRLDQLSFDLEERREQSNYLDHDILIIKNQLEQFNYNIQHIYETVHVIPSMSDTIDLDSFLRVISDKTFIEDPDKSFGYHQETKPEQEKLWVSFRRLIKTRSEKTEQKNKITIVKRTPTPIYEPIILTSFTNKTERSSEFRGSSTTVDRNVQSMEQRLKSIQLKSSLRHRSSSSHTSNV